MAKLMSNEVMELERLRAENEALRKSVTNTKGITYKVSSKGALSLYGMGRFPVTLYKEQWDKIIESIPAMKLFMEANKDKLLTKADKIISDNMKGNK